MLVGRGSGPLFDRGLSEGCSRELFVGLSIAPMGELFLPWTGFVQVEVVGCWTDVQYGMKGAGNLRFEI